jgi:hypothetical protein
MANKTRLVLKPIGNCKDVLISFLKEIKKPPSQEKRPGDVGKVVELRYQTCALWFVVLYCISDLHICLWLYNAFDFSRSFVKVPNGHLMHANNNSTIVISKNPDGSSGIRAS